MAEPLPSPSAAPWVAQLEALMSPSPLTLALAIVLALAIPVFLHGVVFRRSGLTTLPTILLLGPSGAGKTALLTLFERGTPTATHTTQTPLSAEISVPVGVAVELSGQDKYRSPHDPSAQTHKRFLLADTPGHGKLRAGSLAQLDATPNLAGVIYLVDATALADAAAASSSSPPSTSHKNVPTSDDRDDPTGGGGIRTTGEYLHDVLLAMQRASQRATRRNRSAPLTEHHLLVAANKTDLFTSLPAALVTRRLEAEVTRVRASRARALLTADASNNNNLNEDDDDSDRWLGEMGSDQFAFAQLEEFGVSVTVLGGSVMADQVGGWWKWVAERL